MPKLVNYSQLKIIEEIIKNPGINLRELIRATKLSPNYVSKFVNLLIKREIIKEEKLIKKRVYLRRFFFNKKSEVAKNFFLMAKEEKKEIFFDKYPQLRPLFYQIIEEIKAIDFIFIYGSYARFAAEKGSDLDLLIVGEIKDKEKIKEVFVSSDIEPSIKIESLTNFKKRINDDLHKQILRENILIYNSRKFIDLFFKFI